ncbi:hypothetical protein [Halomonas sp. hl-4]|uniref:hypothetical protein n=1 Tax=Halomonas sp. hl-4 TaxID=1761789 RepID=UPI000BBF47CF|nr:hypothetical protein [Halomonas sp. hl-4]SNY95531.1 hypothetical protein SAMN04488142_0031 [Halomonas sp. hl-4]
MQSLPTRGLSKQELNTRNDKRAASLYCRRREIERRNEQKALERQTREFWE